MSNEHLLGLRFEVLENHNHYLVGDMFEVRDTWGDTWDPIISEHPDKSGIYTRMCREVNKYLIYRRDNK